MLDGNAITIVLSSIRHMPSSSARRKTHFKILAKHGSFSEIASHIHLPFARLGHGVEEHDVDPLDLILPRQYAFDLYFMSRIGRGLLGDAQKWKRLRAERLCG